MQQNNYCCTKKPQHNDAWKTRCLKKCRIHVEGTNGMVEQVHKIKNRKSKDSLPEQTEPTR